MDQKEWADPKKTRCLVCDTVGNWENVDEFQDKPSGLSLCNTCGFVTHLSNLKSKEELKEYYRKDYRTAPSVQNLYTGERKIHFHNHFLVDYFKELQERNESPVICDVGAAYGMFPAFMKSVFPKGDVSGVELTLSHRRVAKHEFGINLTEDIDLSKKYDLITSYKVAEHQMDVDKELRSYVEALKDDGRMYISVPVWFEYLSNFGVASWDLPYYYHTNHINCWTSSLFETLLKKVGLEIVKKDNRIYDYTYLCKRNDDLMKDEPVYEDPKEIRKRMRQIKKVWELVQQKDFEGALKLWPNFPWAYGPVYEKYRAEWHPKGVDWIEETFLRPALENTNHHHDVVALAADIYMRHDRWDKAVTTLEEGLKYKPNNPQFLINRAHCFARMSELSDDNQKRHEFLLEAIGTLKHISKVSQQTRPEAISWIYKYQSMLPVEGE